MKQQGIKCDHYCHEGDKGRKPPFVDIQGMPFCSHCSPLQEPREKCEEHIYFEGSGRQCPKCGRFPLPPQPEKTDIRKRIKKIIDYCMQTDNIEAIFNKNVRPKYKLNEKLLIDNLVHLFQSKGLGSKLLSSKTK